MAISHKNLAHSRSEYVRTYEKIRGVDFSSECKIKDGRLPYMENLWRDYDGDGDFIIESVPGYRRIFNLEKRINAMYQQKISDGEEYVVCHAGDKLYRFSTDERDSGIALAPIGTLKDGRSTAFCYESNLFILDGEKIGILDKDGNFGEIGAGNFSPYVPTTFKNSREYEQLNLLTDSFKEKYTPTSFGEIAYGTQELIYEIIDSEKRVCSVVGIREGFVGEVHIPSLVSVGGITYTVESVGADAFAAHSGISAVITNPGLVSIGEGAFDGCSSMSLAVVSDTVKVIGTRAFASCNMLTKAYIGRGISEIAGDAFASCNASLEILYRLGATDFSKVSGSDGLFERVIYHQRYAPIKIEIKLHTPTLEVSSVTVNGTEWEFSVSSDYSSVRSVIFSAENRDALIGADIEIRAVACADRFYLSTHGTDIRQLSGVRSSGGALIKGCTKAAVFDGRIFLSGNPLLPNTVFFSGRGRDGDACGLYFGAYDYMNDGVSGYGVVTMMSAQDTLFVFKSADDGCGSIFYHTRKEISDEIRSVQYPVSYAHSGVCAVGASVPFYDDPIFVSDIGICGFDKNSGTIGRDVVCRSHNVNPKLLSERLGDIRLTVWQGYLVAAIDSRLYLADSRQSFRHETGGREYEWFFVNDMGYPSESSHVYLYHSLPYKNYAVHEKPDEKIAKGVRVVTSFNPANPVAAVYYAIENGKRYHAYVTGEKESSTLSKTSEVLSVGELLFVGCEDGTVLVFNNDMRGKVPARLKENDPNIDEKAFADAMGRRLHADFYDFAGVAPRYVIKTGYDDCDIPYLTKNTVLASVCIKCRSSEYSRIKCEYETDRGTYPDTRGFAASHISFGDFHFDSLSFESDGCVTVAPKEGAKGWCEKQITLYADTYKAPIGIYSISYRFRINGRVK